MKLSEIVDTSGRLSPLSFPPLSHEQHELLHDMVHGRGSIANPDVEQTRKLVRLMQLRLVRKEPSSDGVMRYHPTIFGTKMMKVLGHKSTPPLRSTIANLASTGPGTTSAPY